MLLELISPQGAVINWGGDELQVTSITVSMESSEIDITSMSSTERQDPQNTFKKFLVRDYDFCFTGGAEISVEFIAGKFINRADLLDSVGRERPLLVQFPGNDKGEGLGLGVGLTIDRRAALSRLSLGASVGEFVTGSATFRLSGDL
jgi:hypothetical protein